jgi:hypothetical protein
MVIDELPELSASPQLSMLLRHGLTELTRSEARAELRRLIDQAFQAGVTTEREARKLMASVSKTKQRRPPPIRGVGKGRPAR